MRLKVTLLLLIALMLGGQAIFLASEADAACCNSCPLKCWMCTCPGLGGCAYFYCPHHPDDSTILKVENTLSDEAIDIRANYDSPSPRSKGTDRLITLASSARCAKNNYYLLKFFPSAEDELKFEREFLNYNARAENNVKVIARQMP
jgi:hypothetical protein